MLGFAIETGCEVLLPGTAFLLDFVVGSGGAKMELPLFGTHCRTSRGVAHAGEGFP